MRTLDVILAESTKRHKHLCPRQVLGARMGLLAAELLGLDLPRYDKRLLVISETDGCAVDGIIAATGCRVGKHTLRILDFGKVAATFIDTHSEKSIRIVPSMNARVFSAAYAVNPRSKWEAMLLGYQVMPATELFFAQYVQLNTSLVEIIGQPSRKSICDCCGEEIINGREVLKNGSTFC